MARAYGIKKRLEQENVDSGLFEEIMAGDLIDITERMENFDFEMMRRIYDSCACMGGRDYLKSCEKTGRELADLPLEEKIERLNSSGDGSERIALNGDGSLSVTLTYGSPGAHSCVCSAAVRKGVKVPTLHLIKPQGMDAKCRCPIAIAARDRFAAIWG